MKQNRIRKCLRAAALAVVALILVLAGTVFALWHNEFATLGSFRKLSDRDTAHHDGAVYELTVSGDYYFDDFLAQGGAVRDAVQHTAGLGVAAVHDEVARRLQFGCVICF